MIYNQHKNTQGMLLGLTLTGSHLILRRKTTSRKERTGKGMCCWCWRKWAWCLFLSFASHIYNTRLGTPLSFLLLGKMCHFWITRFLNDFTTISHLAESLRVYEQDLTLGTTGWLWPISDSSLKTWKKKKEEHMFQISLNGQKYFFQSENQKILRALRLMLILQVAQDMRTSRSLWEGAIIKI